MTWLPEVDEHSLRQAAGEYERRTGNRVHHLAAARLGNTFEHAHSGALKFWMVIGPGSENTRAVEDDRGLELEGAAGALMEAPANISHLDRLLSRTREYIPHTLAYQLLYYRHGLAAVIASQDVLELQNSVVQRLRASGGDEVVLHVARIASNEAYRHGRDAMHYLRHHQEELSQVPPREYVVRARCAQFALNASLALHLRDRLEVGDRIHPEVGEVFAGASLRQLLAHGVGVPMRLSDAHPLNAARNAAWLSADALRPAAPTQRDEQTANRLFDLPDSALAHP